MANYEFDGRASLDDKRGVVVNGKRYHMKTSSLCKVCNHPDRHMYVKQMLDRDWMLECPVCDTVTPRKAAELVALNLIDKSE